MVSSQEDTRPQALSREFIRRASIALIVGTLSISTIPAFSQDQSTAPVAAPASPIGISKPTAQDMAMLQGTYPPDNGIWLESLDLHNMTVPWGEPRIGKSVDGKPLTLKGTIYPHGIGAQTRNQMTVDLKGVATRFVAMVGVDDDTNGKGNIDVTILVDGKKVVDTGPMQGGEAPRFISIDLTAVRRMVVDANGVDNKNDSGHVDWAGALLLLDPDEKDRPESVDFSTSAVAYKLPPAPPVDPHPAIHGPLVMGASPNRPFVFLVPVTGKGPFTYAAEALPKGLKLDAKTGVISGAVSAAGTYDLRVTVKGPAGKATKTFGLICGEHKLALTPPLGWNAWNVYGDTVTAEKIKDQVDWLVKTGLAGHGFQYIIIDDSWEGRRDAEGNIGPNKRFGDIKSLADYVHSKGLRLGIYSSPNEETCSGYAGSAGHEEKDAAFYASCGIDYLKYDWCQAGGS
ncbi:MAG: NPCBM/NEW2 domain-containing protein, partial [Abitibacteriaceae bacterium]|nr:NPCBM/NEW2 domain-containing protein [Abditibacteriaceae bacterium]